MAGSKRKRLPLHSNSIRLSGKELQMYPTLPSPTDTTATSMEVVGDQPIPALSAASALEDNFDPPQSPIPGPRRLQAPPRFIRLLGKDLQVHPIPPSPTDTTATSMEVVGDQPIPALSAVSALEDNFDPPQSPIPGPRRLQAPPRIIRLLGKLINPANPQSQTPPLPPTDTTATSIRLVADQPIPAVSSVNGPQDTDNPLQPPARLARGPGVRRRRDGPALNPNALGRRGRPRRNGAALNPNPLGQRRRPRRNGTALDPKSVGSSFREKTGLWESNLWYPGVRIPGRRKIGFQISLGSYLTDQEAQDVHDRAALKLFQTKGVVPVLNFHESRHAQFMEECRDWNFRDLVWQLRRNSARFTTGKSSMKGVAVIKTAQGTLFEAKTALKQEVGKVFYYFGKFESEEEAGRAYDRGLLFLHHKETEGQKLKVITNFRPSTYSESEILRAGRESQPFMDSDPSRIAGSQ